MQFQEGGMDKRATWRFGLHDALLPLHIREWFYLTSRMGSASGGEGKGSGEREKVQPGGTDNATNVDSFLTHFCWSRSTNARGNCLPEPDIYILNIRISETVNSPQRNARRSRRTWTTQTLPKKKKISDYIICIKCKWLEWKAECTQHSLCFVINFETTPLHRFFNPTSPWQKPIHHFWQRTPKKIGHVPRLAPLDIAVNSGLTSTTQLWSDMLTTLQSCQLSHFKQILRGRFTN